MNTCLKPGLVNDRNDPGRVCAAREMTVCTLPANVPVRKRQVQVMNPAFIMAALNNTGRGCACMPNVLCVVRCTCTLEDRNELVCRIQVAESTVRVAT